MKNELKTLQTITAGLHTATNGDVHDITESDLRASAAAYDPAKHEAPLVVGHPQHDSPAYGWVKSISVVNGGMEVELIQVDPQFADMVNRGRFKKISMSFYAKDSPHNPVPGVLYPRHVGVLGAMPPAVKGLRAPSFAEGEKGVVDFSEYDDVQNAGLWRRLREWLIGKEGQDIADQVIPSWTVQQLEQAAQDEVHEAQQEESNQAGTLPAFSEEGATMTPEEKARLEDLEAENAKLKAERLSFAEAEKKRTAAARHTANVAFAESLVGKLLPVNKDLLIATLDFVESHDTVVNFGEGETQKPLAVAIKDMFKSMPKLVEFGELAGGKLVEPADLTDPIALASKAQEYLFSEAQAGRTINIAEAVQFVSAQAAKA